MEENRFEEKLEHASETTDKLRFKILFIRMPLALYILSVIIFVVGLIMLFAGRKAPASERQLLSVVLIASGVILGVFSHFWYKKQMRKYRDYKKRR